MSPSCGSGVGQGETAVLGTISAQSGTVAIPELGLTAAIVNGCFEFRHLTLPRSPMLVSIEISADSLQPAVWAHYIVLATGESVTFTPTLHIGAATERVDPCPSLLSHPQMMSAAQQLQTQLCAELAGGGIGPSSIGLPGTGIGVEANRAPRSLASSALRLAAVAFAYGVTLLAAGAACRRSEPS